LTRALAAVTRALLFVVSYCKLPPPATTERTEATLTMAPPLLRRISGTAALARKT